MKDDERFEAMAEICCKAHEVVTEVGTPVMIAMTRALLWQIGQELTQREARREEILRPGESTHDNGSDLSPNRD